MLTRTRILARTGFALLAILLITGPGSTTSAEAAPTRGTTLEWGDPAPELKIAKWIKGDPVDFAKGKDNKFYLLEFWATWCPPCREAIPHLTELQHKYKDKGLVVIGISDESPGVISSFVDRMGKKMDFTVAADRRSATTLAYFRPFGVQGIPHAFIVDKKGRLVWNGSPFQGMDQIVDQIANDKFDLEAALRMAKANKLLATYFDTAIQADRPSMPKGERKKLLDKAAQTGRQILDLAADSPPILDMLAWNILTLPQLKTRDTDLAVAAARRAYEKTDKKNAAVMDTYARALWDTGKKAQAIDLQEKAVALAEEPRLKAFLKNNLERYQRETKSTTQPAGTDAG